MKMFFFKTWTFVGCIFQANWTLLLDYLKDVCPLKKGNYDLLVFFPIWSSVRFIKYFFACGLLRKNSIIIDCVDSSFCLGGGSRHENSLMHLKACNATQQACLFLSLVSCNLDDQPSQHFHRFAILSIVHPVRMLVFDNNQKYALPLKNDDGDKLCVDQGLYRCTLLVPFDSSRLPLQPSGCLICPRKKKNQGA